MTIDWWIIVVGLGQLIGGVTLGYVLGVGHGRERERLARRLRGG